MITADQGRLVFEPLGDTGWRLCDLSVDTDDAARLVAYVERTSNGGFEAIWLGLGVRPSLHATREDVLQAALKMRSVDAASTRSKPIPIPHLAPVRPGKSDWG